MILSCVRHVEVQFVGLNGWLATCETHLFFTDNSSLLWPSIYVAMLPFTQEPRQRRIKLRKEVAPLSHTHIVMPCPDMKWVCFMLNHLEHTHYIALHHQVMISLMSHRTIFYVSYDISFWFVSCQFFQIHPSALTFCPRDRRGRTLEGHLQKLALYKSS